MKLTVLVDNNTIIDRYFLAEPGLSFYIEADNQKILFDTGYSDAYLINAQKIKINLLDLDYVVISHGHLDHTWGLPSLIRLITEAGIEKLAYRRPSLLAHPDAFCRKQIPGIGPIGSMIPKATLGHYFSLQLSKKPIWLNENVVFLGEIPRKFEFEARNPIGKTVVGNQEVDDFLLDDSAMVFRLPQGLVVVTGCSHAGICNIIEYAKEVCAEEKIYDIIGGFHLLDPPSDQLNKTINYFKQLNPYKLHACHCIDLASKIALSRVCPLEEVGSGISIKY